MLFNVFINDNLKELFAAHIERFSMQKFDNKSTHFNQIFDYRIILAARGFSLSELRNRRGKTSGTDR